MRGVLRTLPEILEDLEGGTGSHGAGESAATTLRRVHQSAKCMMWERNVSHKRQSPMGEANILFNPWVVNTYKVVKRNLWGELGCGRALEQHSWEAGRNLLFRMSSRPARVAE